MATRTIVTSQPDVACDVCERRLLRGEQPDTFLAAGRRRTVCELCAPRAAHEGWMRESETHSLAMPPARPRRGRSFLERLRQVARPPGEAQPVRAPLGARAASASTREHSAFDLLDIQDPTPAGAPGQIGLSELSSQSAEAEGSEHLHGAIALFNSSEFPRRLAGLARSLGVPLVNVRCAEHLSSVVRIVVAWELSWYRYEADLSEAPARLSAIGQGSELAELEREDRVANAHLDERGALALA